MPSVNIKYILCNLSAVRSPFHVTYPCKKIGIQICTIQSLSLVIMTKNILQVYVQRPLDKEWHLENQFCQDILIQKYSGTKKFKLGYLIPCLGI